MAFVPENVLTSTGNVDAAGQSAAVEGIFETAFGAVIDFLFTIVATLLNFFTRPDVLGALVAIVLIYAGYRWFKRKKLG